MESNYLFRNILKITFVLCLFLFGCSNNNNQIIEFHPMLDRMPYINGSLNIDDIDEGKNEMEPGVENYSANVVLSDDKFNSIFQKSEFQHLKLPPLVSTSFKSLNSERLIIFDLRQQIFLDVNLSDQSWNEFAGRGRGPGEFMFANDFIVNSDSLYVISKDSKITTFDCSKYPCAYSKTINLPNLQPVSLAKTAGVFIVMGKQIETVELTDQDYKTESLFSLDYNGNLIDAWGENYDNRGHLMLMEPFANGKIRRMKNSHYIIQYFDYFPFLVFFEKKKLKTASSK